MLKLFKYPKVSDTMPRAKSTGRRLVRSKSTRKRASSTRTKTRRTKSRSSTPRVRRRR